MPMEFDFETLVKRGPASLKQSLMPEEVAAAGMISFDGAEPDFRTAPVIGEAMIRFAENGFYGFTLCDDAYCGSVVWWMKNSRGTRIDPEWVVPTLGTIHSVATAIQLCTEEGGGIIITPPIYNRYSQAAHRLNRKVAECPLICGGDGYRMDFEAIERAMRRPENRLFILCNPHNPIGKIWKRDDLSRLAELADRYDVTVFSDEIFADNCYGGLRCPCYLEIPEARSRGIAAVSLGKAFGFTGVNHANILIADEELRERFIDRRTRNHYGSLDPMVYECLRAAYSTEGLAWVEASNRYVEENIRLVRSFFERELPGVTVYGGEGAYILWMDWRRYFDSEKELMEFLYREAFFCVGPGSEYGAEGFTRMCVASPRPCMEDALEKLKGAARQRCLSVRM